MLLCRKNQGCLQAHDRLNAIPSAIEQPQRRMTQQWEDHMHSQRRHNLIGGTSAQAGVPRRRLLQGAGALGFAVILRPAAVFAEPDDEDERLGPFGPWSTPVNLGPVVNSQYDDTHPAISKNGRSLYISSNRPGGVNGANSTGFSEIWVSRRASRDAHWRAPENLGPVINIIGYNTGAPNFSTDGHLMFFASDRPGGCGRDDLWVARRENKRDDFGWQDPVNLGCTINGPDFDDGPTFFEDEETGIVTMYFNSTRPPGDLGHAHIYASILGDDGSFGSAAPTMKVARRSGGMDWRCSYPRRVPAGSVALTSGCRRGKRLPIPGRRR